MGYNFDGSSKIISLTLGTTQLNVRDLYSRWKDWVKQSGMNYLKAFEVVGGDPIDESAGIYITSYFFLINGWKIKPQEANHKLIVYDGILTTSDGSDPFIQTQGNYNVLVQYSQPIKSETISIGGSSISPAQIANAVWNEVLNSYLITGSAGELINVIKKMVANRVVRNGDIITIYNEDNTVWKQYDLSNGNRNPL